MPNRLTAAVFFAIGSSILFKAFTTSKKASSALSPPAANRFVISSAFIPSAWNASMVVLLPSFALKLNSLTASPTLSMENTPASAPLISPVTNWSADNPNAEYCAEYSFKVSSKSPFWSAPFCAPTAMMLYASSAVTPKFFISALAARADSCRSYPKVSRKAKPDSVAFCNSSPTSPVVFCTTDNPSATSSRLSPKLLV